MPGLCSKSVRLASFSALALAAACSPAGAPAATAGAAAPRRAPPVRRVEQANPAQPDTRAPAQPAEAAARPWLGVEMRDQAEDEPGVLVLRVLPGSPAARAGLEAKDSIVLIDESATNEPDDVVRLVAAKGVGRSARVAVVRNNQHVRFEVPLEAFPDPGAVIRKAYVGKPAPSFEGVSSAFGPSETTLEAFGARPVVLVFWSPSPATCTPALPLATTTYLKYAHTDLRLVAIIPGQVAQDRRPASGPGLGFAFLVDGTGATFRKYGATTHCPAFVIDRAGVVREVVTGSAPGDGERLSRAIETWR